MLIIWKKLLGIKPFKDLKNAQKVKVLEDKSYNGKIPCMQIAKYLKIMKSSMPQNWGSSYIY